MATICKIDESRHLVFGWANVALHADGNLVTDSQGDQIALADLEDAAYLFNLEFRQAGVMHKGAAVVELVESFVVTPDKLAALGLPQHALPGGWWVGFHVPDDTVFAKVKSGEYGMFSIQGRGIREEA